MGVPAPRPGAGSALLWTLAAPTAVPLPTLMPTRRRTPESSSDDARPTGRTTGDADPVGEDPDAWTPDATPFVEGYDVAPDAVAPLVGVGVPAVVAVVVTRNPGPWLETMLASIDAQEYANLTTLVIDAASVTDPTERVAAVLPNAFVKRAHTSSFAGAANAALGAIEGASFYLFCHDDVELGPGTVQAMVEEAFRSNAGVVGAKLVDWDAPEHLRSVGGSIDKFGFSWPIAEPNELDQSQHDAVREAFVVSSATMLVRCDLFADLGGFSTDIDGWGEELDFCWRARIAGGRTVVMPAAVVRHRERAELGDPSGRSPHVALRHQARIMLACYSPMQLLRVAPQALLLGVVDLVVSLVRGRIGVARDIAGAFAWNFAHLPRTLRLRGRVKRSRRVADEDIRRMQIKGSVRVSTFIRRYANGDRTMASTLAAAARGLPRTRGEESEGFWPLAVFLASALVLLVGSRGLIGGGVPAIREFVPIGDPGRLLSEWWSGWRSSGLGSAGGGPTLGLVAGVLNWVTFGSSGFVRTALILAPLPLGAWSSWRLLKGCASPGARAASLLAYLVNPVPYNAIAEGRWQALVAYGAAPALLGRIARAGGWAPFDRATPSPGSTQRQIVGMGLVLAAATTVAPVVALFAVVLCVLVVVTLSVSDRSGRPGRALAVTGGALGLSALLHLPWTISVLGSSNRWAVLTGADPSRLRPLSLAKAVLFDTGSHGGWVSLGLLIAAAVAVLISSGDRLRWSSLAAVLIVVALGVVVLAGRLAPSIGLPAPELVLSLAAVGVTLSVALGVDAFRSDVVGGAFGARQLLSLVAVVAVAASSLPLVTDFLGGRWLSPRSDLDTALVPIRPSGAVANDRTLWIGDGDAVSTQGWQLDGGMKFALTDGVRPAFTSLFPPAMGAGERRLRAVLDAEPDAGTGRLGAKLAPFGIRYVVLLRRLAPLPYGASLYPVTAGLDDHLSEQFDLVRVEVAPGLDVYENLASLPIRSTVEAAPDGNAAAQAAALAAGRSGATPWKAGGSPPVSYSGRLPADRTLVALMARDAGWHLDIGSRSVEPKAVAGWAARYDTDGGGTADLHYSTPASQVLLHILQLLVLAALPWSRRRRVSEFRVRSTRSRHADETVDA